MSTKSLTSWQLSEINSLRDAILTLLAKKDSLLYVQAPALRAQYMEQIGGFEQQVLEAELDTVLLEKKAALMQASINRREPIDMEAIEAELSRERNQLIETAEAKDLTKDELPQLSEAETAELQKIYKEIVRAFHPEMNTEINETQRALYEKACEAYRKQDLVALRLIHEMLFSAVEEWLESLGLTLAPVENTDDELAASTKDILSAYATDYSLVSELATLCSLSPEEAVVQEKIDDYRRQLEALTQEVDAIMGAFPFNAEGTLQNTEKRKAYMESLEDRMRRCRTAAKELNEQIDDMLKGRDAHER